jgi:hypothetical protein
MDHYGTHLSLFRKLCFRQSSGNGFQRRTIPLHLGSLIIPVHQEYQFSNNQFSITISSLYITLYNIQEGGPWTEAISIHNFSEWES